jgi:diaminopimelate decarboxylase
LDQPWWETSSFRIESDRLTLDGHSIRDLAREHGTPLYVYSAPTVRRQVEQIEQALRSTGCPFRIYYALKANRSSGVLQTLRAQGWVGIDACSPREVVHALSHGFPRSSISVTAGMLSNRDLDLLVAEGVHMNLDSFSALQRYAARVAPGSHVGLRLNPGVEIGYGGRAKVAYGNSKFGFYRDDVQRALQVAMDLDLVVDTLHIHCGWGIPQDALPLFEQALAELAAVAAQVRSLEVLNVGGGLGARQQESDTPLALDDWAKALWKHVGPLGKTLACELGTQVVAHAGVLVTEVNTVEIKGDRTWVGVDAGHNVNVYPAHYGIPLEIIAVDRPLAPAQVCYTVAGNLNESVDMFAFDRVLPELAEGDLVAFFPAGAYGASMASDHCMRGWAKEVVVEPLV